MAGGAVHACARPRAGFAGVAGAAAAAAGGDADAAAADTGGGEVARGTARLCAQSREGAARLCAPWGGAVLVFARLSGKGAAPFTAPLPVQPKLRPTGQAQAIGSEPGGANVSRMADPSRSELWASRRACLKQAQMSTHAGTTEPSGERCASRSMAHERSLMVCTVADPISSRSCA